MNGKSAFAHDSCANGYKNVIFLSNVAQFSQLGQKGPIYRKKLIFKNPPKTLITRASVPVFLPQAVILNSLSACQKYT